MIHLDLAGKKVLNDNETEKCLCLAIIIWFENLQD